MLSVLYIFLLQSQEPEGFLQVLSRSFKSVSREIAAQTPRILTALAVFLIFLVLAIIVRRILRTVLERDGGGAAHPDFDRRGWSLISTLVVGGLVFLVVVIVEDFLFGTGVNGFWFALGRRSGSRSRARWRT